jgi:hypothetical protein
MRAQSLVDIMLEAAPKGAVLAFGYGAPAGGFYGNNWDDVADSFKALKLVSPELPTSQAINQLIQRHNVAFVTHKASNDIHVYSRIIPVTLDKEGKDRIQSMLEIDPENSMVAWSRNLDTSAQRRPASDVFKTLKERKLRELDKEHLAQREIVRQMAQPIPESAPGTQSLQPRVKLGFDYDEHSNNGIRVVKVNPNTPASRAGMTSGDILYTVGPYIPSVAADKQPRTYRLKNAQHLKTVLGELSPNVPVPIRVLRGNGSVNLALVPEQR